MQLSSILVVKLCPSLQHTIQPGVGYNSANKSYDHYAILLRSKGFQYNWTWVSIVGWPFYYVSNTALFVKQPKHLGHIWHGI